MKQSAKPRKTTDATAGKIQLDHTGSAVGCARMDPANAYGAVPLLLKNYIETGSEVAWKEITERIDNMYSAVGVALESLDDEAPFSREIKKLVKKGKKKLLFKPNLVGLPSFDFRTHDPVLYGVCLPWEFLAAVMRWFHDRCRISYYQMAVGEAGTGTSSAAFAAARAWGGGPVSTLAVMEGKLGTNYGGWGFYFARKYLAESGGADRADNPMNGYEDSISGHCLPPGRVDDRLLVYDLNKIADDMSNGRDVPVADGINFKKITLHKAIVGGDPGDAEDLSDWPGCVLVNVAKLKIHVLELFTCAIKNLGVGLYPMEARDTRKPGKFNWKYSVPDLPIPFFKMRIPHSRWILQYNERSLTPRRSADGEYVWKETGGMEATMADMIQALKGQDVRMVHVVDAIEATNINHCSPEAAPVPEGFIFASNDIIAADACSARYLFTMIPRAEADRISKAQGIDSDVFQKVPLPEIKGKNIVSGKGYDSAFSRYGALRHCEQRGLGQQRYYAVGQDLWHGGKIASLKQHLGKISRRAFSELVTATLYHTPNKPLWDLQLTCLKYLELNDKLTGSDFRRRVIEAFDEDGDGVIDYLETGRGDSNVITAYGLSLPTLNLDPLLSLELRFLISTTQIRRLSKDWNEEGHDLGTQTLLAQALSTALAMANAPKEAPDPLFPGRRYGKGQWPSFQYALQRQICARVFGPKFPESFDTVMSPYACAFRYADSTCNDTRYCTGQAAPQNAGVITNYHNAVSRGEALLPFTLYVPRGLEDIADMRIPNVEETEDPELIFTAGFPEGKAWKGLNSSRFHLK